MTVLIDKREGSKELAPYIRPHMPVQLGEYDADVAFLGRGLDEEPLPIGIEYKQVADVLKCINDGRFSGIQLPRMLDSFGSGQLYLLIEGAYRVEPTTGVLELPRGGGWHPAQLGANAWLYRQLDNWINTMSEKAGVRVWRTWGIQESAAWIMDLYVWWNSKAYDEHTAHLKWAHNDALLSAARRKKRNVLLPPQDTTKIPMVQQWAAKLPTIGPDKSLIIAEHFKTPRALAAATEKQWREVRGIGKRGAELITKALDGEEGNT